MLAALQGIPANLMGFVSLGTVQKWDNDSLAISFTFPLILVSLNKWLRYESLLDDNHIRGIQGSLFC